MRPLVQQNISVAVGEAGSDEIGKLAMVASGCDYGLIGCGIFGWRFVAWTPGGCETLNRPPHGQKSPALGEILQVVSSNCCKVLPYSCFNLGNMWLFIWERTVQSGMVSELRLPRRERIIDGGQELFAHAFG
jgi:hypothetical protein